MSRVMMALLLAFSVIIALHMTSIGAAWKFLLTFASGAVRAAAWLEGQPPGLYGMDDVLGWVDKP